MTTFLLVQGMDPVELSDDESFNKVRRRLDETRKAIIDYENGSADEFTNPFNKLSFKTAEGGRFSGNYEKIIGVGSDEPKDVGSGGE